MTAKSRIIVTTMAPKRSPLDSPNPIKHQMTEDIGDAIVAPPSSVPEPVPNQAETASAVFAGSAIIREEIALPSHPVSPPRSVAAAIPAGPEQGAYAALPPPSPGSNRARYLAGRQPTRICCNLDLMRAVAGAKIDIAAICVAVYPASANPERR